MKLISDRERIGVRLVTAAAAFVLLLAPPLRAQSADCVAAYAGMSKLYDKPFHIYTIDSSGTDAALHGGRPTTTESIWTGTTYYVMVRGRLVKSRVDIAEMRRDRDSSSTAKATCSHLRDESVNGEPAAVWRIRSVQESETRDTDLWVSRSTGLPLKSDVHHDVGGAIGKSRIISRYEYTNVRAPAGVP